jgi:hypothetical protein
MEGKMMREFDWTDKRKERFLRVNEALLAAYRMGYEEAKRVAISLEERMTGGDAFLHDYEVSMNLSVCDGRDADDEEAGFEETPIGAAYIYGPGNHLPLDLDTGTNWNKEYFNGQFDDCCIGYPVHLLLDYGWSFRDILNITGIWTDITVVYQNKRTVCLTELKE